MDYVEVYRRLKKQFEENERRLKEQFEQNKHYLAMQMKLEEYRLHNFPEDTMHGATQHAAGLTGMFDLSDQDAMRIVFNASYQARSETQGQQSPTTQPPTT